MYICRYMCWNFWQVPHKIGLIGFENCRLKWKQKRERGINEFTRCSKTTWRHSSCATKRRIKHQQKEESLWLVVVGKCIGLYLLFFGFPCTLQIVAWFSMNVFPKTRAVLLCIKVDTPEATPKVCGYPVNSTRKSAGTWWILQAGSRKQCESLCSGVHSPPFNAREAELKIWFPKHMGSKSADQHQSGWSDVSCDCLHISGKGVSISLHQAFPGCLSGRIRSLNSNFTPLTFNCLSNKFLKSPILNIFNMSTTGTFLWLKRERVVFSLGEKFVFSFLTCLCVCLCVCGDFCLCVCFSAPLEELGSAPDMDLAQPQGKWHPLPQTCFPLFKYTTLCMCHPDKCATPNEIANPVIHHPIDMPLQQK